MIKGFYQLDLWCDSGKEHPYIIKGEIYGFPHTFYGRTRQVAFILANRQGWTLYPKQICPVCNGKLADVCDHCHKPLDTLSVIEKNGWRQTVCRDCATKLINKHDWVKAK